MLAALSQAADVGKDSASLLKELLRGDKMLSNAVECL